MKRENESFCRGGGPMRAPMSPVLNYHEFPMERKASQEQGMEAEAIYIKHMD